MEPVNQPLTKVTEKAGHYATLCLRYLQIVGRRFVDDGCQHSAAALTYMTLFAVVPMMTVTFSMFSLVPSFQDVGSQVQDQIFSVLLPNTASAGNEIESYLSAFTTQARTLSYAGVVILVVTAYLMLRNIERVFNRIWSTTGPRRGVSAFLLYWAVLSLGPLLIGAAIIMNTYVLSIRLFTDEVAESALNLLFGYLPLILTTAAFTLLYTVVPNCKVMLRNALTGGIVATIALELGKAGFGYFVSNSSFGSIYGAFATVPIFLLWIYLCWMIILGGAEFVRATENFGAEIRGRMPQHTAAVFVLWLFWKAHKSGSEVSEEEFRRSGISSDSWREVRTPLIERKIISVTESGNYVLTKSLDDLSLWDVLQLFPQTLLSPSNDPKSQMNQASDVVWWGLYKNILEDTVSSSKKSLSLSLQDLFEQQKSDNFKDSNVATIN